jgi:hypothetical protein
VLTKAVSARQQKGKSIAVITASSALTRQSQPADNIKVMIVTAITSRVGIATTKVENEYQKRESVRRLPFASRISAVEKFRISTCAKRNSPGAEPSPVVQK